MTRSEILQVAKPILFNGEMVRAILDGRKTVTRRAAKLQPNDLYFPENASLPVEKVYCDQGWYGRELKAPYKPGCYLYVRETWNGLPASGMFPAEFWYKADEKMLNPDEKWRPSIHMPKEAARIFLRVTDVRVERLQEIDYDGCKAEGIWDDYETYSKKYHENLAKVAYVKFFSDLWDSTISPKDREKYGWAANPWVWVIEFERVEVTE